jgi:hypothetical protein
LRFAPKVPVTWIVQLNRRDALQLAVHAGGGPAARNLLEGRPRQVLAILDTLASSS